MAVLLPSLCSAPRQQPADSLSLEPSHPWPTSLGSPFINARALGGEEPSNPGHRLLRNEMFCKKVEYGWTRGEFQQASDECSERYAADFECAGHHIRLARLQLGSGNSDWDTRAYIRNSRDPPEVDSFGVPIPAGKHQYSHPTRPVVVTTAKGSKEFREMTTNAGFMCENHTVVMYGGRFHWAFGKGKFPGLLRSEARITHDETNMPHLHWSKPRPLIDGTTKDGFKQAFELNCTEGRKR